MKTSLQNIAWLAAAGLFLWPFALFALAQISRQMIFVPARFLGNTTVSSLAYNGPLAGTYAANNLMQCGSQCAANSDCDSFNFVKTSPAAGNDAGSCEVLASENATHWYPSKFVARPNENATFFINGLYAAKASYFKLIPAVHSGYDGATQFPWNTDCMNQGGTAGFMVAMRNNNSQSSKYTTDFKCRVFRHSFAMSQETPTVVHFDAPDNYMKCPSGSVITAMEDNEANFPNANAVRCEKPALPWAVNTTGCRLTRILQIPGNPKPSPMNDLSMTGTADSIWGAQCGTETQIEALVALDLSPDYYNEAIECCPLYVAA